MSSEYLYEPSDLDDELFLSDIPIDLIMGAIESQFDEPLEYRKKDYVQSFITKWLFSKENMMEEDQIEIDLRHEKFIAFLMQIFEERLNIGFVNIDDKDEEEQNELVHLTYRFFIKNIKKNFVNLIVNYINSHKDDISINYEKKKDVTSNTFKVEIDDEYDVLVLSNLGDIIRDIFEEAKTWDDVDTFFNACRDDEVVLELEYTKNAFEDMELTGNFIENYIEMIDDNFIMEIQSKIRNRILKKYPKRTSNVNYDDEQDEVIEENE